MPQTAAVFHDAYRSLNAKKMFWLVLVLSGLVVAAVGVVSINENGLKILFWQIETSAVSTESITPALFYKWIFVNIGVGFWLAWLAVILALISTVGIFPDLITSGSIDLLVSKPISRLRLFVTQYAAGLLFVTLQIAVFSLASFLVIGVRGGVWEPGLFVAVPLVVCMFSYLFSVSVFLGILTHSTVASLLLTLLFWFVVYAVGATEQTLLMFQTMDQRGVEQVAVEDEPHGAEQVGGPEGAPAAKRPEPLGEEEDLNSLEVAHKIIYGIKTVLPKTTETIALLQRTLISMAELSDVTFDGPEQQKRAGTRVLATIRSRSVTWVLGTSLGFQLFVLAWAAFIFCRRDF